MLVVGPRTPARTWPTAPDFVQTGSSCLRLSRLKNTNGQTPPDQAGLFDCVQSFISRILAARAFGARYRAKRPRPSPPLIGWSDNIFIRPRIHNRIDRRHENKAGSGLTAGRGDGSTSIEGIHSSCTVLRWRPLSDLVVVARGSGLSMGLVERHTARRRGSRRDTAASAAPPPRILQASSPTILPRFRIAPFLAYEPLWDTFGKRFLREHPTSRRDGEGNRQGRCTRTAPYDEAVASYTCQSCLSLLPSHFLCMPAFDGA